MSILKTFLPEKGICRVIFTLPDSIVDHAKKVAIVGDFNGWNPDKNLMKKTRNNRFETSITLPIGKNYQFRYLIDSYRWESDWEADSLAATPYEEEYNSVVKCTLP